MYVYPQDFIKASLAKKKKRLLVNKLQRSQLNSNSPRLYNQIFFFFRKEKKMFLS